MAPEPTPQGQVFAAGPRQCKLEPRLGGGKRPLFKRFFHNLTKREEKKTRSFNLSMVDEHSLRASTSQVVCNLPPGYHQYKFIVDGEWRHDENQAFIQDPLGNVNNW